MSLRGKTHHQAAEIIMSTGEYAQLKVHRPFDPNWWRISPSHSVAISPSRLDEDKTFKVELRKGHSGFGFTLDKRRSNNEGKSGGFIYYKTPSLPTCIFTAIVPPSERQSSLPTVVYT